MRLIDIIKEEKNDIFILDLNMHFVKTIMYLILLITDQKKSKYCIL